MSDNVQASQANTDQFNYWNSAPGKKWIAFEEALDKVFFSVNQRLLERARAAPGERVFDIGCGTGATSMDFASVVGAQGSVVGIDISQPLLARAEERRVDAQLSQVEYLLADAQTYDFGPRRFDLLTSRFGVMFFTDPVVAFQNLAHALCPSGRLSIVGWAPMAGNPWFEVPRNAAVAQLGKPSPASPRAPGPLAFQDTGYVVEILEKAGWSQCVGCIETVHLFYPGSVEEVAQLASNIGPSARIVKEHGGSQENVAEIGRRTASQFKQYATEDGVRIPAQLTFFDATMD